jgi:hypothetical protein
VCARNPNAVPFKRARYHPREFCPGSPHFSTPSHAATEAPTSEKLSLTPRSCGSPPPSTSSGTLSRVWSVPLKVGSLPWSVVMIMRASAVSALSSSGSLSSKRSIFCVVLDTGSAETVFAADKVLSLGLRYEAQDGVHPIRGVGGGIEFVFTKRVDCN